MVETQTLSRYRIERELGRGASGVVHQALDTALERHVALKAVSTAGLDEHEKQDLLARFKREATAAARLSHPNIVTIYDFGHEKDTAYIVMELVPGSSLAGELNASGRLGFERILGLMKQLLAGLQAAHEHGVIHRDIKPSNLLLLPDGHLKIADFGVARLESSTVTRAGTILGTPSYMAPEQLAGKTVDRRADLFSAGVILYELLAGRRPFVGDSTYSVIYQVLHADPPLPSELDLPVPKWIDGVVHKALAKNPDERYQDARSFAAALDAAAQTLHNATTTTLKLNLDDARPAPGPSSKHRSEPARRSWWPWAAGLGAIAVLAGGWWASREPEVPSRVASAAVAVPANTPAPSSTPATVATAAPAPPAEAVQPPAASVPEAKPAQESKVPEAAPKSKAEPPAAAKKEVRAPPVKREPARPAETQPAQEGPGSPRPAVDPAGSRPGFFGEPRAEFAAEDGLPPREIAVGLLRRAAESGDARAMNRLGNLLREGKAVERNLPEAAKWFEKAAAAGNIQAALSLAAMYRDGHGVAKDPQKALGLLEKAAQLGHPRALNQLGILYVKGEGVAQNDQKAFSLFQRAAEQGELAAMAHLAYLYEVGRGVSRNQDEALRWYRRAAELGEPRARERLRQLGETPPPVKPPARRFTDGRRPFLPGSGVTPPADIDRPGGDLSNRSRNWPSP